jgi:hypothetical protein
VARPHGKVVRKQTGPARIKGHKVAASPDDPQYILETEEGKRAAHKPLQPPSAPWRLRLKQ